MGKAAGLVLKVADNRREELSEALQFDDRLAEAVSEFKHSRSLPLIVFLCFQSNEITHIARARRGFSAGYKLSRLNMTDVTAITPPIIIAELLELIPNRWVKFVAPRFKEGGLLSPYSFTLVVDAIRRLSRETHSLLDQFSEERRLAFRSLSASAQKALAYQKESVATALALADMDRAPLQTWHPPKIDDSSASFLDGLPNARLREDPMVINDLAQIPGFKQIRVMKYGAAVFENAKSRLTVILANRLPLEKQLGADLIYFNETFRSFIVIQYKAMEKGTSEALYRLPNSQLNEEIARMDETLALMSSCAPVNDRHGFRMTDNPFFLKLCPRIVMNPDDSGLTHGMYIPLEYFRFLQKDDDLLGPKGGRRITYRNVGRYFDNTSFVSLMANSWVGTNASQSDVLEGIIKNVLQSGRSVTLAVKASAGATSPLAEDEDEDEEL